jgi:lysophospholipase L1-like esterase
MDVWLLASQLLFNSVAVSGESMPSPLGAIVPGGAETCAVPLFVDRGSVCVASAASMALAPPASPARSMGSALEGWPRPSQLLRPGRPAAARPSEPRSGDLRPVSGSQLYAFRQASVKALDLYPQALPQRYLSDWQRAIDQPTYDQWQALLAAEAELAAQTQGSRSLTVLVGDSLALWLPLSTWPGQQVWLNQSISGETTGHMLQRLHYFAATRPRAIHLMGGINDLKQGVPETEVVDNITQILVQLRWQQPGARLVVYSILPTRLGGILNDRIQRVNQSLAVVAAQQGATFIDLYSVFSDSSGQLRPELTTDGLHLSPQGYTLWQAALVSH